MKTVARLSALGLLLFVASAVQADEECESPTGRWQSREAVRQLAREQGWVIRRIKIDDGCYEIHGADKDGRRFEARIDPVTLSVVEIERAGEPSHDGEQETD